MRKRTAAGLAGAALVVGLIAGGSGGDDSTTVADEPTPTAQTTTAPEPAPDPEPEVTPEPTPEPEEVEPPADAVEELDLDDDTKHTIARIALQTTWDDTPADDRASMCLGWAIEPEMMLDTLLSGIDEWGDYFDRDVATEFFDANCDG